MAHTIVGQYLSTLFVTKANEWIFFDTLRESRNAIHYLVEPMAPNTYDSAAAYLLRAAPHFKQLYKICRAAKQVAQTQ